MSAHDGADASSVAEQFMRCEHCGRGIKAGKVINEYEKKILELQGDLKDKEKVINGYLEAMQATIKSFDDESQIAVSIGSCLDKIGDAAVSDDDKVKAIVGAIRGITKSNLSLCEGYTSLGKELLSNAKSRDLEEDTYASLVDINDHQAKENIELKKSPDRKTNAMSSMIKMLFDREDCITKLRHQLAQTAPDCNEQIMKLEKDIEELNEQVVRAEKIDKPNLQRRIDDLQEEVGRLQGLTSSVPAVSLTDVREAKDRIKLLESIVADGVATRNELQELNDKYRKDYEELQNAYNKRGDELAMSQDMLSRQVATLGDLRGRLDSLPPPDDLGARIRYLECIVTDLRIKGNQDESEIQKLNHQVDEGQGLIYQLEKVDIPVRDTRIQELQDELQVLRNDAQGASARLRDAANRIKYVGAAVMDIAEAAGAAAELESLGNSVRALRSENENSRRHLEELQPRLLEAERRAEDLTHKLASEQNESDRLRNELQALEDSRRALQEELRRKDEEIEDKLMQINTLSPQLYHAQDRIKHLENEYAEMRSTHVPTNQFNELDQHCRDLSEKLKNERSERDEDKKEIEQLRGTLERVNGQIARHEAELEERDKLIERLVSAIESQERSFDELRRSVNTMEEEKHQLMSTRQHQEETLEEVSKARAKLDEEARALAKGLDQARVALGIAQEEARGHENNLRQIREELGREIARLNDELATRPNIDPAVVGLLREAQNRIKTLEARPYIPPEIETQLQTLERDLDMARAFADKQREEVNKLNDQVEALNCERQEQDHQLTRLREDLEDRDATIAKLHHQIDELEDQLRVRDDQMSTMRALVDDAGVKIRLLENRICSILADQSLDSLNASRHVDDLGRRIVDLQTKMNSANECIEKLERQSALDLQEIQRLNGRVNELENEKQRLQEECDQANKELNETREERNAVKNELERLRNTLEQNKDDSDYRIAALNDKIRELEDKEKTLEKRIDELNDEIASRDDTIRKRDETINDLNSHIEQQSRANTTRPSSMNFDGFIKDIEPLKPEDKKLLARAATLESELDDARKRIQLLEAHSVEAAPNGMMGLLLSQHADTINALSETNDAQKREIEELSEALEQQQQTIASLCTSLSPRLARTPQGSAPGFASLPMVPRPPNDDAVREIESLTAALADARGALEMHIHASESLSKEKDELEAALASKVRECEKLTEALESMMNDGDAIIDAPDDRQGVAPEEVEQLRAELEKLKNEYTRLQRFNDYTSGDRAFFESLVDKDMKIEELRKVIEELNESSNAVKFSKNEERMMQQSFSRAVETNASALDEFRSTVGYQKEEKDCLLESHKNQEKTISFLCQVISPDEKELLYLRPDEITPDKYMMLQAEYIRAKYMLEYKTSSSDEEKAKKFAEAKEAYDKSRAEGIRLDAELNKLRKELMEMQAKEQEERLPNPKTVKAIEDAKEKFSTFRELFKDWEKNRDEKSSASLRTFFADN